MRLPGELSDIQKRRLIVTCGYIDRLLGDVEEILDEHSSASLFPHHVRDLTASQTVVLEEHIRHIREQLVQTLAWQHMKPEPPEIPASRAILTHLAFIDIAIEELKPGYMRGSGQVPEDALEGLDGTIRDLRAVVSGMERYIRHELDSQKG